METYKIFRNWGSAMAYYKSHRCNLIKKYGNGWIVYKYLD